MPATAAFDYPTIAALSGFVVTAQAGRQSAGARTVRAAPAAGPTLQNLQSAVLGVIHSVLGQHVDPQQPLMEVCCI